MPSSIPSAILITLAITLLSSFPIVVLAGVQELWWNITYVPNQNPDGLFPRRVIGVNGTWPPPPISVSTNDTLVVHATNSLDKPTTLHHHGMYFNGTSWFDGAMGVTQCGIPPGATFTYIVPINETDQLGTYWIHAHAPGEYVDGLRAPLVLHPEAEVHSYDEEFTVVIGDWYHQEYPILVKQFLSIADPAGAEPIPDSGLIYFAQKSTYLPGYTNNATLPFESGKTYRLRIINTSAFTGFYFWIDGHDMRIIEVDGTDTQEQSVDLINIAVAQRYSILVTARNDSTPQNWVIHANMDTTMFDIVPDTLVYNLTSSITYSPTAPLTDLGFIDVYSDTNDTALIPIPAIPQYAPASLTISLVADFATMTDGTNRGIFNNITYDIPIVPTVLSALTLNASVGGDALVPMAYGPNRWILGDGDVVDVNLMNADSGKHPFHLHGHKFQIIKRAMDFTSDDPSLNPPIVEGQANPVRRDTVLVPSGTSAVLRFIADNPGAWFLHCHIDWHLDSGLAVVFISGPAEIQQRASINPPPAALAEQCLAQTIPASGNAAGHDSATDLSGWYIGPYIQNLGWHAKGIGAMFGCVFTAVLGMASVTWYALGGHISEEEMEAEERIKAEKKAQLRQKGIVGRVQAKFGFGMA